MEKRGDEIGLENNKQELAMLSVKGRFEQGVARPNEPIAGYEGQLVIITFVEPELEAEAPQLSSDDNSTWDESAWDEFDRLVDLCAMDTGIEDLAHQHNHSWVKTSIR